MEYQKSERPDAASVFRSVARSLHRTMIGKNELDNEQRIRCIPATISGALTALADSGRNVEEGTEGIVRGVLELFYGTADREREVLGLMADHLVKTCKEKRTGPDSCNARTT